MPDYKINKIKTWIMLLAPLLLLLGVAEATLRLIGDDQHRPVYFTYFKGHNVVQYLSEDPDLFWVAYPESWETIIGRLNSGRDKFLALGLGGSIALGNIYPKGIPELIFDRANRDGCELIGQNLASSGYTTHQSRVLLERITAQVRTPDLVIVCHGTNDVNETPTPFHLVAEQNHRWPKRMMRALNKSRAIGRFRFHLLNRLYQTREEGDEENWGESVPVGRFEQNLKAMAALLDRSGGSLVLISQPMALKERAQKLIPYYETSRRLAQSQANIHFVDLRPRFHELREEMGIPYADEHPLWKTIIENEDPREDEYQDALFIDLVGHQTQFAMDQTTDIVFQYLIERGLLQPANQPSGFVLSRDSTTD